MCLVLRKYSKVKIARFPKLVWKIVRITDENSWIGPFQIYNYYKFEECLKAEEITPSGAVPKKRLIITENYYGDRVINYGFHVFRSLSSAKFNLENTRLFYVYTQKIFGNDTKTILSIVPCIIPKGAEYCKGKNYEIVSTDIIVFKNFGDLIKNSIEFIKALCTSRDCL